MIAKCECGNCGVNIEFETESFIESGKTASKIFGQNVTCPNCHKPTILILPNKMSAPIPHANNSSQNDGQIEKTLEVIGSMFLWLGMIGLGTAIIVLVAGNSNAYSFEDRTETNIILVTSGIISAFQGIILNALFRALAEIIRLLRKLVLKT